MRPGGVENELRMIRRVDPYRKPIFVLIGEPSCAGMHFRAGIDRLGPGLAIIGRFGNADKLIAIGVLRELPIVERTRWIYCHRRVAKAYPTRGKGNTASIGKARPCIV